VITPPSEDDPEPQPSQASPEPGPRGEVERPPDDQEPADNGEVEHIANIVLARIENKLEQHLHTQMEMPSADQAADLRERAPEVYHAWIDIARQKADTEDYIQRAQYEVPASLARSGRPWALVALVLVLGFCGYVVSLRGAGIYVGGIVAAFDLAAMLGLFFGYRPELDRRAKELDVELDENPRDLDSDLRRTKEIPPAGSSKD
jgi:hypothetical protein